MATTIWKFSLEIVDEQIIKVPRSAEILHLGNQNGILCLWLKVDPEKDLVEVPIYIHGTGHKVREEARVHIGTAIIDPFVWHVFTDISNLG